MCDHQWLVCGVKEDSKAIELFCPRCISTGVVKKFTSTEWVDAALLEGGAKVWPKTDYHRVTITG